MNLQNIKKVLKRRKKEEYTKIQGKKFLWRIKDIDAAKIRSIAYDNNLSYAIAQVLYSRGFTQTEQIRSFLFSSYEQNVFDSTLFKDATKTVERILLAIEKKEKILVFGDYDVDGITSTSVFLLSLLPLGANINFHLPNRVKDGYGLSTKFVKKAAENNYKLIITVDNGISAFDAALKASELGIDLIITDHHREQEKLPEALAIVNPNQKDCSYPFKELAGVGVSFKIISLLYKQIGKTLPEKIYELLMLGSVADVVPLIGENRYWVQYGLSVVNKKRSLSLSCLMQNSRLNKSKINSLDVGFMISPQINALGRLDDPRDAVKFLISSEKPEVERISFILKKVNEERKLIDRQIYLEIENAILEKQINLEKENIIVAANTQWPSGVIGLVAGKLAHNYGKPAFLFHLDKKGIVKGSCRSIPEFNIFDALNENKDLLLSFGGHSHAAGLKLKQKDLPKLKERLENKIAKELTFEDLSPKIDLDAELELPEMKQKLLFDLDQLEPFGNKNAQPAFLIKDLTLLRQPQLLKDQHVKCSVFSQGIIKSLIFFNRPDLFDVFSNIGEKTFDVAAHVVRNEWNERVNIELQGLDVAIKE